MIGLWSGGEIAQMECTNAWGGDTLITGGLCLFKVNGGFSCFFWIRGKHIVFIKTEGWGYLHRDLTNIREKGYGGFI